MSFKLKSPLAFQLMETLRFLMRLLVWNALWKTLTCKVQIRTWNVATAIFSEVVLGLVNFLFRCFGYKLCEKLKSNASQMFWWVVYIHSHSIFYLEAAESIRTASGKSHYTGLVRPMAKYQTGLRIFTTIYNLTNQPYLLLHSVTVWLKDGTWGSLESALRTTDLNSLNSGYLMICFVRIWFGTGIKIIMPSFRGWQSARHSFIPLRQRKQLVDLMSQHAPSPGLTSLDCFYHRASRLNSTAHRCASNDRVVCPSLDKFTKWHSHILTCGSYYLASSYLWFNHHMNWPHSPPPASVPLLWFGSAVCGSPLWG